MKCVKFMRAMFLKTQVIFNSNYEVLSLLLISVNYNVADVDICRAAGVSIEDSHIFAVVWLKTYFNLCDQSPNSSKTFVNAEKCDVYKTYRSDIDKMGPEAIPLSQNTFCQIWTVMFPLCVRRPSRDIPGKCSICSEIDRYRRESSSRAIHQICKEAHALHRGGMFMRERMR